MFCSNWSNWISLSGFQAKHDRQILWFFLTKFQKILWPTENTTKIIIYLYNPLSKLVTFFCNCSWNFYLKKLFDKFLDFFSWDYLINLVSFLIFFSKTLKKIFVNSLILINILKFSWPSLTTLKFLECWEPCLLLQNATFQKSNKFYFSRHKSQEKMLLDTD